MSDDFKLIAKLAADTTQFDSVMKSASQKSRQYAKESADMFNATRTPAERHRMALEKIIDAYAFGRIDLETYQRALDKVNDEWARANIVMAEIVPEVDRLGDRLRYLNASAAATPSRLAGVRSSLAKVSAAAGGFVRNVHGAGVAITGLVGVGVGKHAFDLAADFDATSASMEVLLRDTQKSKKLMQDLYDFAARTPFEFPEVAAAGKQLLSAGESIQQVAADLKMLGDLALGANVPLSELTDIFRRNSTQAHIFSRDIQEFAGRGIPVIKVLAEQFKVTDGELMKMVEDGKVGFDDVRKALEAMTSKGGQFDGMTDKLGKRMKGIASTAKDDLNSAMREFGNILGETVLPLLAQGAKDVNEMAKLLRGPGNTEVGKVTGAQSERLSQTNPYENARKIAAQLKANEEETRKLLELSKQVSARAENRSSFNRVGGFFDMAEMVKIQEQLNNLARERAALQKIFNQKYDPRTKELAEDVKAGTKEIASAVASASKTGTGALNNLVDAGAKGFRSLSQNFDRLKRLAKDAAEDALRAKAIIESTRTPEERFAAQMKELDSLRKKGLVNENTYGRSAKAAREQFESASGLKSTTDEMESLKKALRTPYEEFQDELAHLGELNRKGLDAETYRRAKAKAEADFIASGPKQQEQEYTSENRALLRGSAEAFSAMNRANDKKTLEKIAEDQLSTLKRSELIQRQQLNAQQNLAVWGNN